jgi:hypothetical protein
MFEFLRSATRPRCACTSIMGTPLEWILVGQCIMRSLIQFGRAASQLVELHHCWIRTPLTTAVVAAATLDLPAKPYQSACYAEPCRSLLRLRCW